MAANNDLRSNWGLAQFMLQLLTEVPGREFHRDELCARADKACTDAGYRPAFVDGGERFSQVMRMAKIVGLREQRGNNPFPLYERKGYWRVQPSLLDQLLAYRMGVLNGVSRGELLLSQAKSEQAREPSDIGAQMVIELELAVRGGRMSLDAIGEAIGQVRGVGRERTPG